jgi:hypothetical protein
MQGSAWPRNPRIVDNADNTYIYLKVQEG